MENGLHHLAECLVRYDRHESSVREVFEKITAVFEQLAEQARGSSSGHEKIQEQSVQILTTLIRLIKPYWENLAITQQMLIESLETPSYYNPEEWQQARLSQERITVSMQRLLPFFATPASESPPASKEKKSFKPSSKSQWMKS